MGILRLILALSVIVAHAGPFFGLRFFGGGVMPVETFFMLSGFYMALVLSDRYHDRWRKFYFNRFCRLFPVYWLLLAGFLAVSLLYWGVVGHPLGALAAWLKNENPWHALWAALANLSMIGCDWTELYANQFPVAAADVNHLIIIGPTWSLSVELLFYALAPLILSLRKTFQIGLFLLALLIRWLIWEASGKQWGPWLYYFPPASWVFFMGGILSYHLMTALMPLQQFRSRASTAGWMLLALLCIIIPFYVQWPLLSFQDWRFYLLVGLSMPFIFHASRRSRMDNHIAAWTYPSYLGHAVILSAYTPLRHFIPDDMKIYAVLALTAGLVFPLIHFDEKIQARFKKTA